MNSDHTATKNAWKFWGNLPLRVKGIVVVALPLSVLLLNSMCTFVLNAQQQDAERWVTHTLQVRVSLEKLLAEIVGSNTACRTYGLNRDGNMFPDCAQSAQRLDKIVLDLRNLTIDNPLQTRRLAKLEPILAQRAQRLLETAIKGGLTLDQSAALTSVTSQRGILQIVDSLDNEEARILVQRDKTLSKVHRSLSRVAPISLLCGIAGGLVGTWLFLTGIVRRVAVIEQQVKIVAEGSPVAVLDHHEDEIGRVSTGLAKTSVLLAERTQALSETHQRLIEQSERANQANVAKSEFLARMSHEIRTPMNAICGMADLLVETPLNEQQDQYVRIFRNNSERLLTLINDILDLSKVESGHLELESTPFDLVALLDKTIDLLAPLADHKHLELIADIAPGVPTELAGDSDRLQQVLVNLIGNAINFTSQGEVVVAVERDVDDPAAGVLLFRISDTGIGMKDSDLQAVFEPFVQADSSITRKASGTGLGLAITKRLVELMGGRIWVESQLGTGSTFCFRLKLQQHSNSSGESVTKYHNFSNLRALVIDDNSTNRLLLRRLLEQWGLVVDEAESGSEALGMMRNRQKRDALYDIVLIDRRMPGMDGFETAEQIRQDSSFRSPVVLMLSSDTQAGDLARARQMGIHATLIKPVKKSRLSSALQKALSANSFDLQAETGLQVKTERVNGSGIQILIAEDAEDNRFLLHAYLQPEGYQIHMVEDGAAALESVRTQRYDIILMDVQMPMMDGYSATREIRRYEAEHKFEPVPILALTAHALKGEGAVAFEAGCSAYLTKPISKHRLDLEIQKHLRLRTKAAEPQYNPSALSAKVQARVPVYLARRRKDVEELRDLLGQHDLERVLVLAHNMKGSGTGYGFPELSKLGAEMEKSAKAGSHAELESQTQSLEALLSIFESQTVGAVS
jgi:signal transduction histidine kinase/CheY-like chemotaxis protein